jgi:hypothetical protein
MSVMALKIIAPSEFTQLVQLIESQPEAKECIARNEYNISYRDTQYLTWKRYAWHVTV